MKFLGEKLLSQALQKDLSRFNSELQRDLAKVTSELNKIAKREEIKFQHVHLKQSEVIAHVYAKCLLVRRRLSFMGNATLILYGTPIEPVIVTEAKTLACECSALHTYVEDQKIWLPRKLYNDLVSFVQEVSTELNLIDCFSDPELPRTREQLLQEVARVKKVFYSLLTPIEDEFGNLLGNGFPIDETHQ